MNQVAAFLPPRARRGFYASAAAMDGGFFLIMTAMPFKVLALGGGAVELGLVPAIGAIAYVVCAPAAGHWSDRAGRARLCLVGGVTLIICALLAYRAASVGALLALQVLMGLGKALYWPVVQSSLGDLTPVAARVKVFGGFNVAWSSGKTAGFLLGGLLLDRFGFRAVFLTGAAWVALAFLALPRRDMARQVGGSPPDMPPVGHESARVTALRQQGWVANLAAYGVLGILMHHLPQWFGAQAWSEARYGVFLGLVMVAQTAVFLLLTGPLRFPERPGRLWAPQLAAMAAVAAVPLLPSFPVLLLVVPALGLSFGVAYAASLHFSLASAEARGRRAGIHEALIGAGGFLPPLLAGFAVRGTGWLGAPYEVAAGLLAVAVVVQIILWGRFARANKESPDYV